jgi:AcrR family transcriptional regulator
MTPIATGSRPRVEGEREQAILRITIEVLTELGYDKLTLDAVAARARASKATLYRRWSSKAELVAEALAAMKPHPGPVDTGSLAGDFAVLADGAGQGTELGVRPDLLCGLATAMGRDPELRDSVRRQFIEPQLAVIVDVLRRAQSRGEIAADVDVELFATLIPALAFYRLTFAELTCEPFDLARQVVTQIILPALQSRSV